MDQSFTVNAVEDWIERSSGLLTLVAEANRLNILPDDVRLMGTSGVFNTINLVSRLCDIGPEIPLAQVIDGIGGYRIIYITQNGLSIATDPIEPEACVLSGLRFLATEFKKAGFPAKLTAFAPGGDKHHNNFNPLVQGHWWIQDNMIHHMVQEAEATFAKGAKRIAPPVAIPDGFNGTTPFYDVRPDSDHMATVAQQLPPELTLQPILLTQKVIGGSPHQILTEGVIREGRPYTWSKNLNGHVVQQTWSETSVKFEVAPEFMLTKKPIGRLMN